MDEYQQLVQDCAEQGKALARQLASDGALEPLYLYARPSRNGQGPGRLLLVRQSKRPPPHADLGLQLVTGEGLRSNVPFENYFAWVWERARRAPILSFKE